MLIIRLQKSIHKIQNIEYVSYIRTPIKIIQENVQFRILYQDNVYSAKAKSLAIICNVGCIEVDNPSSESKDTQFVTITQSNQAITIKIEGLTVINTDETEKLKFMNLERTEE